MVAKKYLLVAFVVAIAVLLVISYWDALIPADAPRFLSYFKSSFDGIDQFLGDIHKNMNLTNIGLHFVYDTLNPADIMLPSLLNTTQYAHRADKENYANTMLKEPDDARSLECFNTSTCILITNRRFGRSGNMFVQLYKVQEMLARCSGAAISPSFSKEGVARFPPMQVFGNPQCQPQWDHVSDFEHVLAQLTARCQPFKFSWKGIYSGMRCPTAAPAHFAKLHLDPSFPSWLTIDLGAWAIPLPASTAVLHFRGGDIFRRSPPPHRSYTQPVCDHYVKAFRHSGATCAFLIAEDNRNPCLKHVASRLTCTQRPPPSCSATCAFTLIARARVAIAAHSSFFRTARRTFTANGKRTYMPYCDDCPRVVNGEEVICVRADRTDLSPWKASPAQLAILSSRSASVVSCGSNATVLATVGESSGRDPLGWEPSATSTRQPTKKKKRKHGKRKKK